MQTNQIYDFTEQKTNFQVVTEMFNQPLSKGTVDLIIDGPWEAGIMRDSLHETSLLPLYPSIENGCPIDNKLVM